MYRTAKEGGGGRRWSPACVHVVDGWLRTVSPYPVLGCSTSISIRPAAAGVDACNVFLLLSSFLSCPSAPLLLRTSLPNTQSTLCVYPSARHLPSFPSLISKDVLPETERNSSSSSGGLPLSKRTTGKTSCEESE